MMENFGNHDRGRLKADGSAAKSTGDTTVNPNIFSADGAMDGSPIADDHFTSVNVSIEFAVYLNRAVCNDS